MKERERPICQPSPSAPSQCMDPKLGSGVHERSQLCSVAPWMQFDSLALFVQCFLADLTWPSSQPLLHSQVMGGPGKSLASVRNECIWVGRMLPSCLSLGWNLRTPKNPDPLPMPPSTCPIRREAWPSRRRKLRVKAPWLRACPHSLMTTQEWPKSHQGSPEFHFIRTTLTPGIQAREGLRGAENAESYDTKCIF